MQSRHDRALGGCSGFRFGELRLEAARIESREQLAAAHVIALLHEDLGNPFAVVEREIHLAQVDVAVQHERRRPGWAMH